MPTAVLVLAAVLALGGSPAAGAGTPCPGGRFAVPAPLVGAEPPDGEAVWVGPDGVAVASGCDAVGGRVRRARRGTRVRARWRRCGTLRRVRLVGTISPDCARLRGVVRARGRAPRRFTAARVPLDLVQPFTVDFRAETEHLIAFLAGHDRYEAVEAFAATRPGTTPLVRAILTRLDETQVDYINDAAEVLRRTTGPTAVAREVHWALVTFTTAPDGAVRLAFETTEGTAVDVDYRPLAAPLPAFGGLTDPAGHAPDVLPVLYRHASGVGRTTSTVTIGGAPAALPPFGAGAEIFHTIGFDVAILPTAETALVRVEAPLLGTPGERWVDRWAGGEIVHAIVARDGPRLTIARTGDVVQRIAARLVRGRVRIDEIATAAENDPARAFVLAFPDGLDPTGPVATGAFRALVDTVEVVHGSVTAGAGTVVLVPAAPAWATTRAVRATVARTGDALTLRQAVGPPGGDAS